MAITVTTLDDVVDAGDGETSLREAVAAANGGGDTQIAFAPGLSGGTLRLAQGEIAIATGLTIDGDTDGDGRADITITGDAAGDDLLDAEGLTDLPANLFTDNLDDNVRIFNIAGEGSATTLNGLILTGGRTEADEDDGFFESTHSGGAVRSEAPLTISDSRLVGNGTAGDHASGGAVFASASVTLDNVLAAGNGTTGENAPGGGIAVGAVLDPALAISVTGYSAVDANFTTGSESYGGGIFSLGSVVVGESEITGNRTEGYGASGGGIYAIRTVTAGDSLVSGNRTEGYEAPGGGVYAAGIGSEGMDAITLADSVLFGNSTESAGSPGGGLRSNEGVRLVDSAVSGNSTIGAFSEGGGASARGDLTVIGTRVRDNTTMGDDSSGGGLFSGGFLALVGSTVAGNETSGTDSPGGGVSTNWAQLVNATLADNLTRGDGAQGGGLYASMFGGPLEVIQSTVSANCTYGAGASGAGLAARTGTTTLTNSIVLGNDLFGLNTPDPEISTGGTLAFEGANLVGNDAAAFDASGLAGVANAPAAEVFAETMATKGTPAGVLRENGGQVATIALAPGANPAVDAATAPLPADSFDLDGDGDTAEPLPVDARGLPRDVDQPGVGGSPDLGAYELQEADQSVSIAAADAGLDEGDAGTTAFTFTVTRSGLTGDPLDLDFAVTGSGAAPADAADFGGALPSGTVSFAGGETEETITVEVSGDTVAEFDEGFTVALSTPSEPATLPVPAAEATILNDDPLPEVSIVADTPSLPEGDDGAARFGFFVNRTGDTADTLSLDFAVTGSGADPVDAADFGNAGLISGRLTIPAESAFVLLIIDVIGDTELEPDEDFTVTLSNPSAPAEIVTPEATATVENDDTAPFALSPGEALVTDNTQNLAVVDLATGAATVVGQAARVYTDIAVGPDGAILAATATELYRLDRQDFSETEIGALPGQVTALGFAGDGVLYAAGLGGDIFRVDPQTAATEVLASGVAVEGDLLTTGTDLLVTAVEGGETRLSRIDRDTGTRETLATVSFDAAAGLAWDADGTAVGFAGTELFRFGPDPAPVALTGDALGAVQGAARAFADGAAGVPTVALTPGAGTVAEGETLSVGVAGTGLVPGATLGWTVTGLDPADLSGPASGTVTLDGAGEGEILLGIAPDAVQDDGETLTLSIDGFAAEARVTIEDVPPALPTGVIRGTGRDDALASGAGAIYLPGDGADTFLISAAGAPGETAVFDATPGDVVQLSGGLEIAGFVLAEGALQLDLASGARVQVLNPGDALFEPGGNVTTEAAGPRLSYAQFAADVLDEAVPPAGQIVPGGNATVPAPTGTDPVAPQAGPPAQPEGVIRGTARDDTLLTGAGTILLPGDGDDTVIVSTAAAPLETTVVEGEAGDLVEFVGGLEISAFVLTPSALALTLATGAAVQLLEADALLFAAGGNATAGAEAPALDYAGFAEQVLGATVPESGTVVGDAVTIPEPAMGGADMLELMA